MEPQLTNFAKLKKIVNEYSDNKKSNVYDSILFNICIFIVFILILCCFLSYKYRIKNNISF